jgi:hypothetical membrane protein
MTTDQWRYAGFWHSSASVGIGGFLGALCGVFHDDFGPIHWDSVITMFLLLPAWVVVTTALLRDVKLSSIYTVILCASYLVGYELVWWSTHGSLWDDLYLVVPIQTAAYCVVASLTGFLMRRFGRATGV